MTFEFEAGIRLKNTLCTKIQFVGIISQIMGKDLMCADEGDDEAISLCCAV